MNAPARKLLSWLWPGYGVRAARIAMEVARGRQSQFEYLAKREREELASILNLLANGNSDELAPYAQQIHESEGKRRSVLEEKASTIVGAAGIAATVVSAVPVLYSRPWNLLWWQATTIGMIYLFAIINLFAAVCFAVGVRRVTAVVVPSAEEFERCAKADPATWRKLVVVHNVVRCKLNEPLLTQKANCLFAAESFYLRGLIMFAVGAVLAIGFHMLRGGGSNAFFEVRSF